MSDKERTYLELLVKVSELNYFLTEEIFHQEKEGSLGSLLRAYRGIGGLIEESLEEKI